MTKFVGTPLRGIEFSTVADEAISARVNGDTQPRIRIDAGGKITWSDGSVAGDTNIYRSAANYLTTDDVFKATNGLVTLTTNGAPTAALDNGAIAIDTTNHVFYFRSNNAWNQITGGGGGGASVTVSDNPPASPTEGDLWFESDTAKTYVYYDGTWVEIGASGGVATLDDIGNVTAPTPASGDFLKWNGTAWVNDPIDLGTDTTGNYVSGVSSGTGISVSHTPSEGSTATVSLDATLDNLSNVTVPSPATNDVLQWNGTAWVNVAASTVGATSLDGLSDVVITTPAEFQTLEYDGTNWANAYASTVTYVRNAEATTLTTGTVVYLYGATGDHADVKRADKASDTTSSKTVGLVGANITASNNGPVVTRGYVDGIDLSVGYSPGDVLWLGSNGQFTKTKAIAPDHLVFVGVVVRATNNGIVYVATQNGYELDELHNVNATSPNPGDFLKYNGTLWVNDQIDLGTDTVGNYVQSLVAGTGVTLTNGTASEGGTPTIAIGQAVGTTDNVTFAGATLDGVQVGVTAANEIDTASGNLTIDSAGGTTTIDDDLVVSGNLTVNGTTTTLNTDTLTVEDNIIVLNSNVTAAPTLNAGIEVERGTSTNVSVRWNETSDKWEFTNDGTTYGNIAALGTIALGTDTTGNYMSDLSAGTGISVTHTPAEGSTGTVAIDTAVVPQLAVTNTFTTNQIITGSTTADLLKITQTGAGNAFSVVDSTGGNGLYINSNGGIRTNNRSAEWKSWSNTATFGSTFYFDRSRGTTYDSHTAVQSGDLLGTLFFRGSDGSTFNNSATIASLADSTVSTGVVPGRLIFSTSNSAGTLTERMRINANGGVGIGGTAGSDTDLGVYSNITGATTAYGIRSLQTIQSDVTSIAHVISAQPSTAAVGFTVLKVNNFSAFGGTIGATSAIGTQVGFFAASSLTVATNNYAFQGSIANGTGRWNLVMDGTAPNYLLGRLGVGATLTSGAMAQVTNTTAGDKAFVVKGAASQTGTFFEIQNSAATPQMVVDSSGNFGLGSATAAGYSMLLGKTITGATTSYGVVAQGVVQSDVTSAAVYMVTAPATAAASFTLPTIYHYLAQQGTFGVGSSVTSQAGFTASSTLSGAGSNYGFLGQLSVATGRWNIYMSGTAGNYLAGRLGVGATLTSGAMAQVVNTTAADDAIVIKGATSQSGYLTKWSDNSNATLAYVDSVGNAKFVSIDGGSA